MLNYQLPWARPGMVGAAISGQSLFGVPRPRMMTGPGSARGIDLDIGFDPLPPPAPSTALAKDSVDEVIVVGKATKKRNGSCRA